jgi:hypothetical protein
MNPPKQDDLLKEVFADEALETLRQQSLASALGVLRARQRRRRILRTSGATAALVLAVTFALQLRHSPAPLNSSQEKSTSIPSAPPTAIAETSPLTQTPSITPTSPIAQTPPTAQPTQPDYGPNVKIMTDDDLFALFPNRLLVLTGKPGAGTQQLVFLDDPAENNGM